MKLIKPFPTIEDVFENPEGFYKTVFFPLLTIDLEKLGKGTGKVHFVSVHGSGNDEILFSGDKLGLHFINFKRCGNKYYFEGDLSILPHFDKLPTWYDHALDEYEQNKDTYLHTSTDYDKPNTSWKQNRERCSEIDEECNYYMESLINYWVTRDKYFETDKFIQGSYYLEGCSDVERNFYIELNNDEAFKDGDTVEDLCNHIENYLISSEQPQSTKGKTYIGSCAGYNYREWGEDELYLFTNEQTNEVIQFFIWS